MSKSLESLVQPSSLSTNRPLPWGQSGVHFIFGLLRLVESFPLYLPQCGRIVKCS